jgi:hypothetical protein
MTRNVKVTDTFIGEYIAAAFGEEKREAWHDADFTGTHFGGSEMMVNGANKFFNDNAIDIQVTAWYDYNDDGDMVWGTSADNKKKMRVKMKETEDNAA